MDRQSYTICSTAQLTASVLRAKMPSNMNPKGGRIEKEAAIALSNVMLVCPSCDKTTRIKSHRNDNGKNVRYCMRCDKDILTREKTGT